MPAAPVKIDEGRRSPLRLIVALVVLVLGAAAVLAMRGDEAFGVGDSREITVLIDECWRTNVDVADTSWGNGSSNPAPVAWGNGSEAGSLERTAQNEAVFTSAQDGQQVVMGGGTGEVFFDLACPLSGRP